jgi:hypothetical protein
MLYESGESMTLLRKWRRSYMEQETKLYYITDEKNYYTNMIQIRATSIPEACQKYVEYMYPAFSITAGSLTVLNEKKEFLDQYILRMKPIWERDDFHD